MNAIETALLKAKSALRWRRPTSETNKIVRSGENLAADLHERLSATGRAAGRPQRSGDRRDGSFGRGRREVRAGGDRRRVQRAATTSARAEWSALTLRTVEGDGPCGGAPSEAGQLPTSCRTSGCTRRVDAFRLRRDALESASSSSDVRCEVDRPGAADLLIDFRRRQGFPTATAGAVAGRST